MVRIWPEDTDPGLPGWRGHIIHVLGNEDCYFDDLDAISKFIRPFLAKMGVRIRPARLLSRWLAFLRLSGPPG